MEINKILTILDYPSSIDKAVKSKISRNLEEIKRIAETAYQSDSFDFPLCKRRPVTRLAVVTYLLGEKYEEYLALGTPKEVINETFKDVTLRAKLYYEHNKKAGLSKDDVIWFRHIMNVNIFKIGSLQFQPFQMVYLDEELLGETYMVFTDEQKKKLPANSNVINCHIQYGAELSQDLVSASFTKAKALFKELYPTIDYKAILCYSWLLYPKMIELLPDSSNIRCFAQKFTIIGSCSDTEQAFENLDIKAKRDENSADTFLQRNATQHPDCFGFACGIIELNCSTALSPEQSPQEVGF